MLMVTTSVRMFNRVHGNTSNLRPLLSLSLELVELVTGLQDGFISSSTGSDQTDHGSSSTSNGLSGTRGQSNSGLGVIIGVTNDDSAGS